MSTSRPLQNRVAPNGEICARPARGLMMGNRGGRLHGPDQRLGIRRWASKAWISCRLSFNNRRRQVMNAGYTELFFLDEATALAAGHRPCFECRRKQALAFAEAWANAAGLADRPRAPEMDAVLHAERLGDCDTIRLGDAPDGVMVRLADGPALIWGGALRPWSFDGYATPRPLNPDAKALALTPASVRAVLSHGYRPMVHPSADRTADPARADRREGA